MYIYLCILNNDTFLVKLVFTPIGALVNGHSNK